MLDRIRERKQRWDQIQPHRAGETRQIPGSGKPVRRTWLADWIVDSRPADRLGKLHRTDGHGR